MEKNKTNNTNKSLIVLCTILIIIIIALVGFIGFTLGNKTTTLPKEEQTEEELNNEEIEFNDYKAIKDLSIKIDKLLGANQTKDFNLSQTFEMYGFRSGLLKNKLTKEDKQLIVLETVAWDNITGDAWKNYEKMKETLIQMVGNDEQKQQEYLAHSHQISAEKVNEQSLKLFGEIIENPIEEVGGCPIIYYDANSKTYFRPEPACGGATVHYYVKNYKSKFTTKKDEVYVYVNFAYIGPGTYNGSYGYYEVYKDIKDVNSLENYGTFIDKYTLEDPIYSEKNFTVNERNYQHFSEYKFTFKKDKNDNYYFVDVKQTK